MKKIMILMGFGILTFSNNQMVAKADQSAKNPSSKKKKKAYIDVTAVYKRSKGFAKLVKLFKEEQSKMQEYEIKAKEILSDPSLSDELKKKKVQVLSVEAEKHQLKIRTLGQKLDNAVESCIKQFDNEKIVNYKKIVKLGVNSVTYNKKYLEEEYDDLTEEYIKRLDKVLRNLGLN